MTVKVLFLAAFATVLVSAQLTDNLQNFRIYGPLEVIDMPKLWDMYKTSFNKNYSPVEDQMRLKMFEKSVKTVVDLNMKAIGRLGEGFQRFAVNAFSDYTLKEREQMFGFNMSTSTQSYEMF